MEKIRTKTIGHLTKYKLVGIILLFAFLVRIYFQSPFLEDWDSVQFAQAIESYSIADQRPHPPGYIVYVYLAKLINSIVQDPSLSLTFLSALLGTLSYLFFYFLSRLFLPPTTSLLASLIFISTPLHINLSTVGLSNIPGLSFNLLTTYLLFKGLKQIKFLFLASFLAGLTLGIRFAEYSILISLLIFSSLIHKKISVLSKSLFLFFIGILLWLIPLTLITGFDQFMTSYANQASYIINHDSYASSSENIFRTILIRLKQIYKLFEISFTIYYLPWLFATAFYFISNIKNILKPTNIFLATYLLSYLIPLIFIYNLEVPRHLLPLLPSLTLIGSLGLLRLARPSYVNLFLLIMLLPISFVGLSKAYQFKNYIPPTIAPILYTQKHFTPENTTLVTTFTYRQFEYYAPQYSIYYGDKIQQKPLATKYVIIDFQNLMNDLPQLKSYKIINKVDFEGPYHLFPRLNKTSLFILEKID